MLGGVSCVPVTTALQDSKSVYLRDGVLYDFGRFQGTNLLFP